MIIKDLNGKILLSDDSRTLKASLESAIDDGKPLDAAILRKKKLTGARLDGMKAAGACFSFCDFAGADMADCDLREADLRGCDFTDACLAGSDLTKVDFRGSVFCRTILDDCVLDGARVSCPGFFFCDLAVVKSMTQMTYTHRGEQDFLLDKPPLVIQGLRKKLVISADFALFGGELIDADPRFSQAAINPIPKIGGKASVL